MTGAVDVWTDPDLVGLVRRDATLAAIADALVSSAHRRSWSITERHRPAALAAAALVVLVAALAPAVALSKGLRTLIGLGWPAPVRIRPVPVQATLTSHVPATASPGTRVRITWTLWSRNRDGQSVPFDSGGIFARIVNPARTAASTAPAHGRGGRYSAIIRVPRGGIGRVQVGILATRFGPNATRTARVLFPITNYP